jgi:hypothetical protein
MASKPNNNIFEVVDRPGRKIGGVLRSNVSRAMVCSHRMVMKKEQRR